MLAADPSAFLEACYCEAHVSVSDVPAGFLVQASLYGVWLGPPPRYLLAAFWLRSAPRCHVEPEPVFTCHFFLRELGSPPTL